MGSRTISGTVRDGIRFSVVTIRFVHSKNAICNNDDVPRPIVDLRPPKARPGIALPSTNMQEDDGPTLTLQDALCMVTFID